MATWLQKGISAVKKVAKPLVTTAINAGGGLIGMPALGTSLAGATQAKKEVAKVQTLTQVPEKGTTAIKQSVNNVQQQTRAMETQQQNENTFMAKAMAFAKKNWMYLAIGGGLVFALYYFMVKKKRVTRRRR